MRWRSSDRIRTRLRNSQHQAIRSFTEINGLDQKNDSDEVEFIHVRLKASGRL